MHSLQCKISGGHETEMGKLRGVQGAALSHVMGKENPGATVQCLRAGMAARVFTGLHYGAVTVLESCNATMYSNMFPGQA